MRSCDTCLRGPEPQRISVCIACQSSGAGDLPNYLDITHSFDQVSNAALEWDSVTRPEHYNQGGIECIAAIRAALTQEEFRGFCKGNALKYVWRERLKGGGESLQKAAWYLGRIEE